MAVLVVVVGIAVPSLREFAARNQVVSSRSALVASLAFARAGAARRGTAVFVVASAGGTAGNEYGRGWDVYADNDGNGVFGQADAPSLRHFDAPPPTVAIRGAAQVTFAPTGYLAPAAVRSFRICPTAAAVAAALRGYLVTLPPSGLADVSEMAVSDTADCTS